MLDPRQLYSLNEDVAAKLKEHRPVLIHQLDGFVDAGQAGRLFSAHLLEQLDHEVLATFDHDQLHDYRSRRPAMVFDTNQWKSYADLHLRLYRMVDEQGEVFLLLQRTRAGRAVGADGCGRDRADRAVRCSADGQRARHPDGCAAHPSDHPDRARDRHHSWSRGYRSWIDRVEVPASFTGLLEFRLGQLDRKAMGFAAHVPHYLAQADVPRGHADPDPVAEQRHRAGRAARTAGEGVGRNMADIAEEMAGSTGGAGAGGHAGAAVRRASGRPNRAGAERGGDRRGVRALPGRPREERRGVTEAAEGSLLRR